MKTLSEKDEIRKNRENIQRLQYESTQLVKSVAELKIIINKLDAKVDLGFSNLSNEIKNNYVLKEHFETVIMNINLMIKPFQDFVKGLIILVLVTVFGALLSLVIFR